jgi:hypothetical protein
MLNNKLAMITWDNGASFDNPTIKVIPSNPEKPIIIQGLCGSLPSWSGRRVTVQ